MNAHPRAGTALAAGALFASALALTLSGSAWAQTSASAPAPSPPSPSSHMPTPAEVDAGLDLYIARLTYAIARFRTNPPEGITRYTEGIVQLRIDIDANGALERQALLKSSGNPLLDRHATNILQSAVPQTDIPSGLRNRAFYIAVTIDFSS